MLALFGLTGPTFLAVYLALFAVAILVGLLIRRLATRGSADLERTIAQLAPEQIAVLRDGPRKAFVTAFVRLVVKGRIKKVGDLVGRKKGIGGSTGHVLDDAIWQALGSSDTKSLDALSEAVQNESSAVAERLPPGLVLTGPALMSTRILAALPAALVFFGVGIPRLLEILDGPKLFLLAALGASIFVAYRLFKKLGRVTQAGKASLAVLENRYAALGTTALRNADMLEDDDAVLAYAIFGNEALTGRLAEFESMVDDFGDTLAHQRHSSMYNNFYAYDCATSLAAGTSFLGGIGSGSGCSSCSSCGGGCGGCGGCG